MSVHFGEVRGFVQGSCVYVCNAVYFGINQHHCHILVFPRIEKIRLDTIQTDADGLKAIYAVIFQQAAPLLALVKINEPADHRPP
jgi:hypothetical protein